MNEGWKRRKKSEEGRKGRKKGEEGIDEGWKDKREEK